MNKEELIKFLREQSNFLKELNMNSLNELELSQEELDTLSYNFNLFLSKIICLVYADVNYIKALIHFSNNENSSMHKSALIGTFGVLTYIMVNKLFKRKDINNNSKEQLELQIQKFETSIEFLLSLTDEEENKYLNFNK